MVAGGGVLCLELAVPAWCILSGHSRLSVARPNSNPNTPSCCTFSAMALSDLQVAHQRRGVVLLSLHRQPEELPHKVEDIVPVEDFREHIRGIACLKLAKQRSISLRQDFPSAVFIRDGCFDVLILDLLSCAYLMTLAELQRCFAMDCSGICSACLVFFQLRCVLFFHQLLLVGSRGRRKHARPSGRNS